MPPKDLYLPGDILTTYLDGDGNTIWVDMNTGSQFNSDPSKSVMNTVTTYAYDYNKTSVLLGVVIFASLFFFLS